MLILHKAEGLVGEDKASLLDVGHIQHAVDERNQMVGDNSGLATVFLRQSISFSCFLSISRMPIMPFRGVRISWDILAGKRDFSVLAQFCVIKRLLQLLLLPDLCRVDIFHVQEAHLEAVNYRLIRPVRNSVTTLETVSR